MKKRNSHITVFLVLVSTCLSAQVNRALIVAISDYPAESGWEKIHAVNDCKLIIPMLKANGYKDADIKILTDKKATKAQIVKELQNLATRIRLDDCIYIHLSGHGQQMADDNGDEEDGLDEAFIPYDANFRYKPGLYEGENHLRDDELELLIDAIRRSAGENGNVMVVIDACHSGTGTRLPEDDEYIRGTSYIFAPTNFSAAATSTDNFRFELNKGAGLAPITVFSACQPEEVNYEYKTGNPGAFYGRLTYFFCQAVMEQSDSETNLAFYIRLENKMKMSFEKKNRKQTPYFESVNVENKFIISHSHEKTK